MLTFYNVKKLVTDIQIFTKIRKAWWSPPVEKHCLKCRVWLILIRYRYLNSPGVNFTYILRAALTCEDPKIVSVDNHSQTFRNGDFFSIIFDISECVYLLRKNN
jgi:hypothetical protein